MKTLWEKEKMLVTSISYLKAFNPFPNKPWFLRVCSTSLLKTLWEKEKLLIISNFSFYHRFFKSLVSQGRQKALLCGNGLKGSCFEMINSLPNNKILALAKLKACADDKFNIAKMTISVFVRVENIVGKGINAV